MNLHLKIILQNIPDDLVLLVQEKLSTQEEVRQPLNYTQSLDLKLYLLPMLLN
jgi:hypothetical protein